MGTSLETDSNGRNQNPDTRGPEGEIENRRSGSAESSGTAADEILGMIPPPTDLIADLRR